MFTCVHGWDCTWWRLPTTAVKSIPWALLRTLHCNSIPLEACSVWFIRPSTISPSYWLIQHPHFTFSKQLFLSTDSRSYTSNRFEASFADESRRWIQYHVTARHTILSNHSCRGHWDFIVPFQGRRVNTDLEFIIIIGISPLQKVFKLWNL